MVQNKNLWKTIGFFFVFFYVITLIHEFGHALFIIFFYGFDNLLGIQIGFLELTRFELLEKKFILGLFPLGGETSWSDSTEGRKGRIDYLKNAMISFSGILVSLLFSAVLVSIVCWKLISRNETKTVKNFFKKFFNFNHFIIVSVYYEFLSIFGKKMEVNEKLISFFQNDLALMNKNDHRFIIYAKMITYLNLINLLPIPGLDGFSILRNLFCFFFPN